MKPQHRDRQVLPYPQIRQWTAAAYRSVSKKPMIHGLIEVDVTKARTLLREHKSRTGASLSFTAFLTVCLAKAVDEHKAVQAMRMGHRRVVIFDDVDVWIPIEHEAGGQKMPLPHVVRVANHKSVRTIHDEIRAAQVADVTRVARGPRVLPAALFGPALWVFWQIGRLRPQLQKRSAGTVALTAVGMFGKGAGWGVPPPFPTPLMLTVGGIGTRQEVRDGQIATREYLSLTISVDHTIVDGAPAARFTQRLAEFIESGYGLDDITSINIHQSAVDGGVPHEVAIGITLGNEANP